MPPIDPEEDFTDEDMDETVPPTVKKPWSILSKGQVVTPRKPVSKPTPPVTRVFPKPSAPPSMRGKRGRILSEKLSHQETFRVSPSEHEAFFTEMLGANELARTEGRSQFRSMSYFFRSKLGLRNAQ